MNSRSRFRSSSVWVSYAKSMASPDGIRSRLYLPASIGLRAAEHVDLVGQEDLLVGDAWVALLDEREHVGRRRIPAAVGLVEHDLLRGRIGRDADPVGVGPGGQGRQHGQRRLYRGPVGHPGHGRVLRPDVLINQVRMRTPETVQREPECEHDRDGQHGRRADTYWIGISPNPAPQYI